MESGAVSWAPDYDWAALAMRLANVLIVAAVIAGALWLSERRA